MADFRQREADLEFRRGLEELVRGHLDGCMGAALSSSSSSPSCVAFAGEDDEEGNAARRRRRSDLEGDDLAESSAAARRQSRVFSRWVARQAEEMITTMERRNRESELMALAGLHTVSMLDPSFLRESRRSPPADAVVERPVAARASSVLQMWRELEDMTSSARTERRGTVTASALGGQIRSQERDELGGESVNARETEYNSYAQWIRGNIDSSPMRNAADEDHRESNQEQFRDHGDDAREGVRQIVRGWMTESEIPESESRISPSNETQRAQWLGEIERERVRLVREWVQMTSQQQRDARASRREDRQRERNGSADVQSDRFRRESLRLRGRQARLELITRMASERQRELLALSEHRAVSQFEHRHRIQKLKALDVLLMKKSMLRGRFLRNGVVAQDDQARPPSIAESELGQLREHQQVSGLSNDGHDWLNEALPLLESVASLIFKYIATNLKSWNLAILVILHTLSCHQIFLKIFSHLNRVGFHFQSENIVHDEASNQPDPSANQIVSVTDEFQDSNVTDLPNVHLEEAQPRSEANSIQQIAEREGMLDLESVDHYSTHNMQESPTDVAELEEEDAARDRVDWEPNIDFGIVGLPEETREPMEEINSNWQENMDQDWPQETTSYDVGEDTHLLEVHGEWHEDEPPDTVEVWQGEQEDPATDRGPNTIRRVDRFIPPDDENIYSMELRELLGRRSVSNLLRSGFRESLDRLVQSYVQRQGTTEFDWDLGRPLPTPAPEEDEDQTRDDQNQATRRSNVFPAPPLPLRPPLWNSGLHHNNWTRQNMHRSEIVRHLPAIEWDAINDLKADMARLQQGMSNMQKMLEACIDMQVELQRAVRQEVSAALNQSPGGDNLETPVLKYLHIQLPLYDPLFLQWIDNLSVPKVSVPLPRLVCGEEPSVDGFKWNQVRKGICCVCCHNHIDSLLYRCGHMCTCSMCAHELERSGGKCPLCRAPIVEVVRAYSIV
ncbi:hypothetical protein ZIOFF_035817 [Zingiber officinale]|uniref:RING-type domain-containing protein n=1 Tax=Zingiber officinale TaxID=94328 RepID=A0A8J5L2Y0_ZINOF|nr:hypothetical protein ZIOFF_035817 [Zingiber officinale]